MPHTLCWVFFVLYTYNSAKVLIVLCQENFCTSPRLTFCFLRKEERKMALLRQLLVLGLAVVGFAFGEPSSVQRDGQGHIPHFTGNMAGNLWDELMKLGSPNPPFPKCRSSPPVPPRKDIQQFNTSCMNELLDYLQDNTLGPCKEGPHSPSSTALSGAFILGGEIHHFNYGCVSKSKPNTPPTNKSIYRLASNSKPFAVETVIKAYLDGKIHSFDDELREYFNDFYIPNPFGSSQPTFRQMMSQMGGIPREGPCQGCNISTSEMLSRLAKYDRLLMPAWTYPSYSNLAFGILANLVSERLYNKPWSELLDEDITKPLGMHSTGINYTSSVLSRMVTNYLTDGSEAPFYETGWLAPAGGVYSTSEDMALWVRHFLDEWKDDSPLGQLRRNMMIQLHENPGGYSGFSTPWEIISSHGYLVRTKSGDLPGLESFISMVPELDFGLVLLWNGAGIGQLRVGLHIFDSVIPVLTKQYSEYQRKSFPQVSRSFTDQYFGVYHSTGEDGSEAKVNFTEIAGLENVQVATITTGPEVGLGKLPLLPRNSTDDMYEFQIFMLRENAPCFDTEVNAELGEWVQFHTLPNGTRTFTIPGLGLPTFSSPPSFRSLRHDKPKP